ncbi:MAG TPA: hypothetical protein VKB41_14100 [Steroidobacteraceae bacterium]|nr:hypothetical protein [Steroidobacteraceae bacterium]
MPLTLARLLITCATALVAPLALADVTIVQQFSSDGFGGAVQLGAMDGNMIHAISGHNARFDMSMKLRNAIFGAMLPQGGNFLQIIRLDDDRIYQVDASKKSYTEETFADVRAANARLTQQMQSQGARSAAPSDESQCQWTPAKAEVKKTGEHATIAGVDTEHDIASVTRTCTKGADICDFVFQFDQWLAVDMPGGTEQRAFWKEYGKRLALDGDTSMMETQGARMMLSRFPDAWGALFKAADSLKGYPLKATMLMQFGGPHCSSGPAATPGDSGTASAAPKANPMAAMAGLLGKFKHKPAADSSPSNSPDTSSSASTTPGMTDLFRVTTTTTSISTSAVSQDKLRVPAGYAKSAKSTHEGA